MWPCLRLCASNSDSSRKQKKNIEAGFEDPRFRYPIPSNRDPFQKQPRFPLRPEDENRNGEVRIKKKGEMVCKVSNFSDMIHRVTSSCLHPLGADWHDCGKNHAEDEEEEYGNYSREESEEEEEYSGGFSVWEGMKNEVRAEGMTEMNTLLNQVSEAVSAMKRAYGGLQEAHYMWDPERIRIADVAVVAELRRIGMLMERFKRSVKTVGNDGVERLARTEMPRAVAAPYKAVVEEMKKEVKARKVEVENLKEQLRAVTVLINRSGKKGRSQSRRKVSCIQGQADPAPELFEAAMCQVKEASKSFTCILLSLMRSAHWDIAAAISCIEAVNAGTDTAASTATSSIVTTHHAKYALESYVSCKIFQGFDHETFYMDGNLSSSLLNADQFRRDCFTQYCNMKAMDPGELLGILPTCNFGKFCLKKYLSIVHPKMEESLFGDLEQRCQVLSEIHPRSQFYGEFLALAKAVWLLHLLAFSLDPAPSQFEASRGAEFHPHYMESVVKSSGGRVPAGQIVGFPVSPGFKLRTGSVIKARVYLITRP